MKRTTAVISVMLGVLLTAARAAATGAATRNKLNEPAPITIESWLQ
jgi:hypothetical protein